MQTIKFNKADQPEFFKVLRKRVHQYFQENQISKYGNTQMKIKTIFMICLYFIPMILLFTGVITNAWLAMGMWALMGMGMSGIGLSIMHDANHGAYSKNPKVNKALGWILNVVGGYHHNWKIQHNVKHHSYTNVHEHDDDIGNAIMRLTPDREQKPYYKYQLFYAPLVYTIMTLYWVTAKDFVQLNKYHKENLLVTQGLTYNKALRDIILLKIAYYAITLVLPLLVVPFPWWHTVLGFLLMHGLCGLVLALIFQPAHVIEETDFFKTDENGSLENSWAILQMRTTANFADKSVLFSWFIGGLNYQIEHHLFPNICHVHYKALSKIVKQTAKEFNVPYHEHRTFLDAVRSHFSLLHQLGTGAYDRKVAV